VQALDHLSVILSALATRTLGGQALHDPQGRIRVTVPGRDLEYFVDLACGQIRRYGAAEPRVMKALLRLLDNAGRSCRTAAYRAVVARQVTLVVADAARMTAQPVDLIPVQAAAATLLSLLEAG
jgi:uncharacterized membrane protein